MYPSVYVQMSFSKCVSKGILLYLKLWVAVEKRICREGDCGQAKRDQWEARNGGRASELGQKTSQRKTGGSTRLVTAPPLILKTYLVDDSLVRLLFKMVKDIQIEAKSMF